MLSIEETSGDTKRFENAVENARADLEAFNDAFDRHSDPPNSDEARSGAKRPSSRQRMSWRQVCLPARLTSCSQESRVPICTRERVSPSIAGSSRSYCRRSTSSEEEPQLVSRCASEEVPDRRGAVVASSVARGLTTKLTCRYGAQPNSGRCSALLASSCENGKTAVPSIRHQALIYHYARVLFFEEFINCNLCTC